MDIDVNQLFKVVRPETPRQVAETWWRFTPTGLEPLRDGAPQAAFETALLVLLARQDSLAWQMGDLAVEMARAHGVMAYEKLAARYLSERQARTVEDWAYVCRNVGRKVRRPGLTIAHHRKVAPLGSLERQVHWLAMAEHEGWSVRRLGEEMAREGKAPPPPRVEDRLHEFEMENASLHRRVDALAGELKTVAARSERSESILESIRTTLAGLVAGGPEGLASNPAGAFEALKTLLERLGR